MKTITYKEVEKLVDTWFNDKRNKIFTSFPKHYEISFDSDDCIFIHAEWENNVTDFAGLGNMYKFLWENEL